MKSVKEIVKGLTNLKVVLGNGFDLFCGLKTSYRDFFDSKISKYNSFKNIVNQINYNKFYKSRYYYEDETNIESKIYNENTVWDLYFYLISGQDNNLRWCDIEKAMHDSFFNNKFKWENIYNILTKDNNYYSYNFNEYCCAFFIKNKYFAKIVYPQILLDEFYEILLDELNIFEKSFGEYILNEQEKSKIYFPNCINTIKKFSDNKQNITSIETFNYTNISDLDEWPFVKINNINGDTSSPIFGIDYAKIGPNSKEFNFTKTSRKLKNNLLNKQINEYMPFDNLLIFGHSLNEHDYSYIFPLLDELDLFAYKGQSKLILAYYVYDNNKKINIIDDIRLNLSKLIFEYENSKGRTDHRLLDSLMQKQRIILYEIDDSIEITTNI